MTKFEKEPSWVDRLPDYGRVEINPIPFKIVLKKYELDKEKLGILAHDEFRLYDDSKFCIDIIDVFKTKDMEDGTVYSPDDDRWLDNLGIDATDIPAFVKHYRDIVEVEEVSEEETVVT